MANTYNINTLVQINATFQTAAGVNTDPTTVTATLKDPTGVESALTVTKDGVGLYHAQVTPTLAGVYYYGFIGSGGLTVAGQGSFVVRPNNY